VELDVLLYGLALLLEFVALWRLRVRNPICTDRIVFPWAAAIAALAAGPIAVLLLAGYRGRTERAGPISALTLGLIIVATGVVVYWLTERRRVRSG